MRRNEKMKKQLDKKQDKEFIKNRERGASMIEYGILVALISVVAIAVIQPIGGRVGNAFNQVNTAMDGAGLQP
jgi:pilus assembly protein Flp/PilA